MKKRGIGIATIHYPTGLSGGGDPSQAVITIKHDGTVNVLVGSVDIGQGCKTVFAQIAAEELGVPMENIVVRNDDTDACPMCMGTFASRVTHMAGNAVMLAAREARQALFEVAAEELGTPPEELAIEEGKVVVMDRPEQAIPIADLAARAYWAKGKIIAGRGSYSRPGVVIDPDTGAGDLCAGLTYATTLAEVEVDTETGVVDVLRLISAYDVGSAINPMMCEGQIEGGTAMGLGQAIMEDLHPYYPDIRHQPKSFGDYMIPTAKDISNIDAIVVEMPLKTGPYGAKGIGETTANSQPAAIVNAIHNAIGVWITDLPATPEKVLKALEEQANRQA